MDYVLLFNDLLSTSPEARDKRLYLYTVFRPKAAFSIQLNNRGTVYFRFVKGNPNAQRDHRGFLKQGEKGYDDSTAVSLSMSLEEISKLAAFFNALVNLYASGQYNKQNVSYIMDSMNMFMHDFGSSSFKIMHDTTYNNENKRKDFIVSIGDDGTLFLNLSYTVNGEQKDFYSVSIHAANADLYVISNILNQLPIVMASLASYSYAINNVKKEYNNVQQNNNQDLSTF